jgi:hypothetical protein
MASDMTRSARPTALTSFFKATQDLREEMERDLALHEYYRLSLENHIALLQMTYIEWKRRNVALHSSQMKAA